MASPLLLGNVVGLLLLDERDDHTLMALLATPLTVPQYAFYRLLVPVILCLIYIVALTLLIPLSNLVSVPLVHTIPLALVSVAQIPLFALFQARLYRG